jgi:hypothetical protein
MKARNLSLVLAVVGLTMLFALQAAPAYGCSCMFVDVEEAIGPDAVAAFIGRPVAVQEVDPSGGIDGDWVHPRQWTFEVEVVLAGELPAMVEVGSGYGGGDCGYDFSESGRIGVVAYGRPGDLATGICGGVWDAELLLSAHGPGYPPIPVIEAAPPEADRAAPVWPWLAAGGGVVAAGAALLVVRARREVDYQDGWGESPPSA